MPPTGFDPGPFCPEFFLPCHLSHLKYYKLYRAYSTIQFNTQHLLIRCIKFNPNVSSKFRLEPILQEKSQVGLLIQFVLKIYLVQIKKTQKQFGFHKDQFSDIV